METTNHSIHCNVRGGDCYNPTCMLNNKCVDFVNRESYLKWKDEEHSKQIFALHRLRMEDAASAIAEANELRAKIKSREELLLAADEVILAAFEFNKAPSVFAGRIDEAWNKYKQLKNQQTLK